MSYSVFQTKVNALIRRAGGGIIAYFSTDEGTHKARLSDGTEIISNESSLKVTVRWNGRSHQGMATI